MKNHEIDRRRFIGTAAVVSVGAAVAGATSLVDGLNVATAKAETPPTPVGKTLKISVFDIDATPPIGSILTYDPMVAAWDLGLRAKGVVLTGAGAPIVLCAVDWIGIANESQDVFKQTLADAVGTDPNRVAVHTLHQHDAPICDFSAEKMLKEMDVPPESFNSGFAKEFLARLGKAAEESLKTLRPVTEISLGKAPVHEVASNRRIMKDGKVRAMRATSCGSLELRNEPEGLIDPDVTLIGFWEGNKPIAVMSFYATHPQSYYLTKIANPDFPGVARFYRQLAVPDALHIHFNGAGGNIGAGKYNDGSKENRLLLAQRLADGMERAWRDGTKIPVTAEEVSWETEPVALPVAEEKVRLWESKIATSNMRYRSNTMPLVVWAKRAREGKTIDIGCLGIGKARVLLMPGELCVEYQLAAKKLRPDLAVSMAAYGDYGPYYICPKEAYGQGGYEDTDSPVTAEVEEVLMSAVRKLLVR